MKKLRRSKRNKVIFGVCAGLSDYLRIDVTLVRIIAILAAFMGPGIILYLAAALIMPEEKDDTPFDSPWGSSRDTDSYSEEPPRGDPFAEGRTGPEPGTGADSGFESEFGNDAESWDEPPGYRSEKNRFVLGAILVGLGVLVLGKQFLPALFDMKIMAPLLLIVIGGIIIYRGRK